MEKTTYDHIMDYCTNKYGKFLMQPEKDYVLRQFMESYYQALENYKKKHKEAEPDEDQKKTMMSSLLNDATLHSYADSAQRYYEKFTANIESEYAKKVGGFSFLKNIAANILASFLYSIILIIVFWVAKDQIAAWLSQLVAK